VTSNPRLSLAHFTLLDRPPPEFVRIAARSGYDFVGLRMMPMNRPGEPRYELAEDPDLLRQTKRALTETGIRLLDVEVAQIREGLDPGSYVPAMEVAAELGARFVLASVWTPNRPFVADCFGALCDLAKPLGLTVVLEFMSFSDVATLTEALEVVRKACRSNAGVLIDTLHFHLSRCSLRDLMDVPPSWVSYVHVSDGRAPFPATYDELRRVAREERLFPGEGDVDVHGILQALPAGITYAVEVANPTRAKALGAQRHARLSFETVKRFLDIRHRRDADEPAVRS
jgi:sugar phosphate isomerase/epimerase